MSHDRCMASDNIPKRAVDTAARGDIQKMNFMFLNAANEDDEEREEEFFSSVKALIECN